MNDTTDTTTVPSTTSTPGFCEKLGPYCIGIFVPCVGACILLAIVVVIIVICRRRKKDKIVRVHLPDPLELDLQSRNGEAYRSKPENNTIRELPPLPINESERPLEVVVTTSPLNALSPTQKPLQPHSPNYQNVPEFLFGGVKEHNNDDNDDDDDDEGHDYQNNPIEREKYEEEQRWKKAVEKKGNPPPPHANTLQVGAHANTLQVGAHPPSPSPKKTKSFHPTCSHSSKLSSSSGGPQDLSSAVNSACHSPARKGYINMSKSLENLDKRTVPQPPPLPSNPVIKVPSMERHCSPPKPHIAKSSSGYVNQPA